jgi:hypothetical protein
MTVSEHRDVQREVRGAAYRGDGEGVVATLAAGGWDDVLQQLAGDGIVLALAQQVAGAPGMAEVCVTSLRARGWEGDSVLADQLAVALGQAPAPSLRCLAVDLDDLSEVLEGDGMSGPGGIDVVTGEVWPGPALEYAEEMGEELPDREDPERWLHVECVGSHDGYRDMQDFISTVTDADRADRLSIALSGRGAFRRFKDVLASRPRDLRPTGSVRPRPSVLMISFESLDADAPF